MKKIILMLTVFTFLSCGSSIYYAYEYKDNENNSYCTLEITKKKEIIYRGSSDYYWADSYPFSNLYIYIYSDKFATDINKNHYGFVSGFSELYLIENEEKLKYKYATLNLGNNSIPSVFYSIEDKDTIVNTENKFEYLKKIDGFKENGIKWFPPYMIKIDKIDYAKFRDRIQHMNLKDPRKEKK